VVNGERVVLGLLREKELRGDPTSASSRRCVPGRARSGPLVLVEELARYMAEHAVPNAPITTSDGRLVGLITLEDAARVAQEVHALTVES
jgi:hypothetical protein